MGSNKKQALVDTKKSKRKKKGRPSLIEIEKRRLQTQIPNQVRRSTRRNHNPNSAEEGDEEEEEDEEDLRKEKKVKFVGKIPNGSDLAEESGSDSDGSRKKKRKIDVGAETTRQNSSSKGTDENLHGNPSNSGPTTPLPDKKLLMFILDRLQKKDTYGVFSEPVDAEELPDYHDIIKHPMDFSTVRKKLDGGTYENLEQFENDVFLISSNAMQYNADDTVYYRQARSIQELARKDFESLRHESDDNESEPKVPRRGRPPMKNILKRIGRPPIDRTGSEFSSNTATLANAKDGILGKLNPPRDAARRALDKPYLANLPRVGEEYSGSPLKGIPTKNWKRFSEIDENRRNTYNQPMQSASFHEPSILSAFDGERKVLMPVGLFMMNAYARSLARFAANLGPIGWEIASKRIEKILPPGTQFGPGWIGQNESPQSKENNTKIENHETTTSNDPIGPVKHENEIETLQSSPNSKLNGFHNGQGMNLTSHERKPTAVGSSSSSSSNNDVKDVEQNCDVKDVEQNFDSVAKLSESINNHKVSSDVKAEYSEDTKQRVQQKQPALGLKL